MTVIQIPVNADVEDGYAWSTTGFSATNGFNTFGVAGAGPIPYVSFMQFDNIPFDSDAIVIAARIYQTASVSKSATTSVNIAAYNYAPPPPLPTSNSAVFNSARTPTSVLWNVPSVTQGSIVATPDISTVIEYVTNLSSWVPNSSIIIDFRDSGTSSDYRQWYSYENASGINPYLYLEYQLPDTVPPTITSAPEVTAETDYSNLSYLVTFTATDDVATGTDELRYEIWTGSGATGAQLYSGTATSGVSKVTPYFVDTYLMLGANTRYLRVSDTLDNTTEVSFTINQPHKVLVLTCELNVGDGFWTDGDSGFFQDSNNAYLGGYFSAASGHLGQYIRYPTVLLNKDEQILSAYLRGYSQDYPTTNNQVSVHSKILAAAEDDPALPTTYADAKGRPRTAAVAWSNIPVMVGEELFTSPDVSPVIQAQVNRAGWASGNALLMFIEDNGSDLVNYHTRRVKSIALDGVGIQVVIVYPSLVEHDRTFRATLRALSAMQRQAELTRQLRAVTHHQSILARLASRYRTVRATTTAAITLGRGIQRTFKALTRDVGYLSRIVGRFRTFTATTSANLSSSKAMTLARRFVATTTHNAYVLREATLSRLFRSSTAANVNTVALAGRFKTFLATTTNVARVSQLRTLTKQLSATIHNRGTLFLDSSAVTILQFIAKTRASLSVNRFFDVTRIFTATTGSSLRLARHLSTVKHTTVTTRANLRRHFDKAYRYQQTAVARLSRQTQRFRTFRATTTSVVWFQAWIQILKVFKATTTTRLSTARHFTRRLYSSTQAVVQISRSLTRRLRATTAAQVAGLRALSMTLRAQTQVRALVTLANEIRRTFLAQTRMSLHTTRHITLLQRAATRANGFIESFIREVRQWFAVHIFNRILEHSVHIDSERREYAIVFDDMEYSVYLNTDNPERPL